MVRILTTFPLCFRVCGDTVDVAIRGIGTVLSLNVPLNNLEEVDRVGK